MGPRAGLDGRKISSTPGFDPGPYSVSGLCFRSSIKYINNFNYGEYSVLKAAQCTTASRSYGERTVRYVMCGGGQHRLIRALLFLQRNV